MSRRWAFAALAALVALVGLAGLTAAPALAASNPALDEWDFVRLLNKDRWERGIAPLQVVPGIQDLSRTWSATMASDGTLRHDPRLVENLSARFPDWRRVAENVGYGGSVTQVHDAFMNSEGHRNNILNPEFTSIGVGVVWNGTRLWVTQKFLRSDSRPASILRTPLERVSGTSDPVTSVVASRRRGAGTAAGVVVARSDAFPDALAGGPLAAVQNGPVLLSPPDAVPGAVVAEAARVLQPGGTVHLLGGPAALAPAVEMAFRTAGLVVERIAGADRFGTAAAVAPHVSPNPATVFVVSGEVFPDAVVASAPAGAQGAPILLVARDAMPTATSAWLTAMRPTRRVAVGGTAVITEATARLAGITERVAGADRFATAAAVANTFFPGATAVALAGGGSYADALVAAPEAARAGMAVILTAPTPSRPTYDYVGGQNSRWARAVVFGNTSTVPTDAVTLLFS
ncbi:MAG TPA: cell wall-binding repeat-containing protein [Acidimicrobiales bacterium]|nr:cell wall-binding repeat-containing protein [Acidimicrobiales bacterium]